MAHIVRYGEKTEFTPERKKNTSILFRQFEKCDAVADLHGQNIRLHFYLYDRIVA